MGKDFRDETVGGLDQSYFSEVARCEDLLSMLSEIDEHETHGEFSEALFRLNYKDIPFEICSPIKKAERLEELEEILDQIKDRVTEVLSNKKAYDFWIQHYPELISYVER